MQHREHNAHYSISSSQGEESTPKVLVQQLEEKKSRNGEGVTTMVSDDAVSSVVFSANSSLHTNLKGVSTE